MSELSQQPYFLRALYEWCVDSGHTPYLTVRVDNHCRVPLAFVKNGQIVLNIGPSAVRNLQMDNEWVTFSARFGGVAHAIEVPVGNVLSIYARETGQGMGFAAGESDSAQAEIPAQDSEVSADAAAAPEESVAPEPPPRGRPQLRVVK